MVVRYATAKISRNAKARLSAILLTPTLRASRPKGLYRDQRLEFRAFRELSGLLCLKVGALFGAFLGVWWPCLGLSWGFGVVLGFFRWSRGQEPDLEKPSTEPKP